LSATQASTLGSHEQLADRTALSADRIGRLRPEDADGPGRWREMDVEGMAPPLGYGRPGKRLSGH
jgi:hypothetical protein